MNSGATIAYTLLDIFEPKPQPPSVPGKLRCVTVQQQADIVTRQVQIMSIVPRPQLGSGAHPELATVHGEVPLACVSGEERTTE